MRGDDPKRRKGGMSEADRAIWERVTATLDPLPERVARRRASREKDAGAPAEETALTRVEAEKASARNDVHLKQQVSSRFSPGQKLGSVPGRKPPAPKPAPPPLPDVSGIDRHTKRRIARGTIHIDDRIDLHGMTQNEAHMRLKGFLRASQARGHRHVLVITGKGRNGPMAFGEDRSAPGVLKRALPHWLSHPEFRDLIAGLEEAHVAHGGAGAYYIRLRRRKGDKR